MERLTQHGYEARRAGKVRERKKDQEREE